MEHKIECRSDVELLEILRLLMNTQGGVLCRTWEFRRMMQGDRYDGGAARKKIRILPFPEYSEKFRASQPLRIDGVSLVKGASLASTFEETCLVRFREGNEDEIDLMLDFDMGEFRMETDDQEAYEVVFDYIDKLDAW